jgi:CRISPR-associated protein Cmr5
MSRQSLAQRRAAHALKCVEQHLVSKSYGNYVSYVESLPATILMNGLGQAAATLLSKTKGNMREPHGLLYNDLKSWLCGNDKAVPYPNAPCLMKAIIEKDQRDYLRAQSEALAWLVWLKKFANAYLKREDES